MHKLLSLKRFLISAILIQAFSIGAFSQVIATFSVASGKYSRSQTPVSYNITQLTSLPDSVLVLEEITGKSIKAVPYQIENGRERLLWWVLEGETKAGQVRKYQLVRGSPRSSASSVRVNRDPGGVEVAIEDRKVLRYNAQTVNPPAGVSSYYKRSGFIHPLWSPSGAVLTTIQPKDHYHHYGIWNPWTKASFEGREIDFWNLNRRLGTVRFSDFINVVNGSVYGGFKALHNHVVYPDSAAEKIAMKEVWDVRVFNLESKTFLWDFSTTLNLASGSKITLEEYRYGGFGLRATEVWTNKNSKAYTSEGKTRKDADGSTARWAWVNGDTEKGTAGVLFMSNPANYNHPEPIRMWPEDANGGRGDVFFNFSPTKNKSWSLSPGKDYTLKYRIFVFDGEISPEQCEALWIDFSYPPVITAK